MPTSTPAIPYLSSVIGLQHASPNIQYVRDDNMVWDNGGALITGGFRPMTVADGGGNAASTANSTTTTLPALGSWTGSAENVSAYNSVVLAIKTDASGMAYMDFSPDGVNWDSSLSFVVASGVNEVHRLSVTRPYYRSRFSYGESSGSYLRLTSLFGSQYALTSTLNSATQNDADAVVSRSILMGIRENDTIVNVPVTAEGHLETVIHGPRNPFGSLHVENLTPIFQVDGVYGINNQMVRATTGLGGSLTNDYSQFIMQTNTSVGGNATLQTRKRLRYRPGQGAVGRFTARFTSGVANSVQVAGLGHAEDGLYFGYSGDTFGVLHSLAGVREVQTLSLSASATAAANASVTLNGTNFSIPLSNSSNPYRTAYEISTGVYAGWTTEAIGSGVVFVSSNAGSKTSPFLFSGLTTNAAGTFSETRAGVALTENWVPQTQWNNDVMDGTGPSAMDLDPTKGNVYQIGYQYLGYGTLTFQVESPGDGNNPDWTTVHVVRYPNTSVTPNFRNPSFPLTVSAYSLGSTTNLTVNTASLAGFVEGQNS